MSEPDPQVPYGGFVTRTLAIAFDALVINLTLAVVTAIIGLVLSVFGINLKADLGTVLATASAWTIATIIYFTAFWTLVGQTPGMRLLGIKVVSAGGDGGRMGLIQALRRLIGMVISALLLFTGFLLVLVSRRRQGLHDKIAHTLVLYAEKPSERFDTPGT